MDFLDDFYLVYWWITDVVLGIVGEYVGKMYNETKARPRFLVSENLMEDYKK